MADSPGSGEGAQAVSPAETISDEQFLASLWPEARDAYLEQWAAIDDGRCRLGSSLKAAQTAIAGALAALQQLQTFYDVEYVDGHVGGDVEFHLRAAARSIRDASAHHRHISR